MNDASTPLPSAGWYRDPAGGAAPRWWNGTAWAAANTVPADATPLPAPAQSPTSAPAATAATANAVPPVVPNSPTATLSPAATTPGTGPAASYTFSAPNNLSDTGTNTWQIWLLALLPLIAIPSMFAIDTSLWFPSLDEDPIAAQLRQVTDPGYLVSMVTGWLVFGLSIPLSIFDRRILHARGIDRPFHWAFIFLGNIVYVIGRSVVVRRRTGQGLGPLWAVVAVQLIAFIAGVVFAIGLVGEMATFISEVSY